MLGALSLLANSGADFSNAGMASDMDEIGLQGRNLSSCEETTRSLALALQQQLMGFCKCMLSMNVKSGTN